MGLLLNAIFREPFVLLGIFFIIIGAASLLFKVFNITEPRNKYVKGNEKEKQNSKKAFVYILIAILIGVVVFIYWLRNKDG